MKCPDRLLSSESGHYVQRIIHLKYDVYQLEYVYITYNINLLKKLYINEDRLGWG